jgi:hypothetical protein
MKVIKVEFCWDCPCFKKIQIGRAEKYFCAYLGNSPEITRKLIIQDWCLLEDLNEIRKQEYAQGYLDAWSVPHDDLDEVSEVCERARELWEEKYGRGVKKENL